MMKIHRKYRNAHITSVKATKPVSGVCEKQTRIEESAPHYVNFSGFDIEIADLAVGIMIFFFSPSIFETSDIKELAASYFIFMWLQSNSL